MGAFGFSVRTGIEKVAARTARPRTAPQVAGHDLSTLFPSVPDLAFANARTPGTQLNRFLSDSGAMAGAISQADQRIAELGAQLSGIRTRLQGYGPTGLGAAPAHHPEISSLAGQYNSLLSELEHLTTFRQSLPGGALAGHLAGATRTSPHGRLRDAGQLMDYRRAAQNLLDQTRKAHGASGVNRMLESLGISPAATGTFYSPHIDPKYRGALAGTQAVADAARGVTTGGPAPSAAPGFMARHGGKVLAGAGLLGGGLLLSNLMSKKRDEQAQGPYGPVYR